MPQLVLTALKFLFLALLYLFLARAIRVIYLDLVGTRAPRPAQPRPAAQPKKKRASPRTLIVTDAESEPRTVALTAEGITIGRGDSCQIVLSDTYASQFHARVFSRDGGWFVEDLGSTNGTYLNRAKVAEPTPLGIGDEIRIGKTTLEASR